MGCVALPRVGAQRDGQVTFPEIDPDVWRETSRESADHEGAVFAFVTLERR